MRTQGWLDRVTVAEREAYRAAGGSLDAWRALCATHGVTPRNATRQRHRLGRLAGLGAERQTALLIMTDLHYGKATMTFNAQVFARRLRRVGERVAAFRATMPTIAFDELVIALLGDVNDGSDIYPGQAHAQDVTNVEAQAWELSGHLAEFTRSQVETWGRVRYECVPGNHGRLGKQAHIRANWDIVAYRYLAARLGAGVPVGMNEHGSPFLRKIQVYDRPLLLHHGHEIKSYASIPWYGLQLRLGRWSTTALAPFDLFACGHYHSCGDWMVNRINVLMSGTMVSDDDWALETLGYQSQCYWWLVGVRPGSPGLAWQVKIPLVEAGDHAGLVEPAPGRGGAHPIAEQPVAYHGPPEGAPG